MDWLGALLQLNLPVGLMPRGTMRTSGLGRPEYDVALDRYAVGAFDGSEAGGDPGFAGGDGLAVAAAVGAFGQGLAKAVYFADVSFAFVGVSPTDAAQSRRLGLACTPGTPGPVHGLSDILISRRQARKPRASGLGLPSLSVRSARSTWLRQ